LAVYKPFIIGLIWSCVTVILPTLFFDKQTFNAKIFLWSFQQLVFIALLAIVFDIKDSSSDAEDGLNTFIIQLGFKRLKIFILYPLLLISCFATFFSFYPFLDSQLNLIFLPFVPFIAALLLIKRIHEQKPVLYYLAWVDGLLLVKAASGIMLFYCKN
jgi:1,4-dihydroxy-2-naphthoate octaprenyltransferase